MRILRTATVAVALTALSLSACGRSGDDDQKSEKSAAVGTGKAKGTISVWAMGTEGEKLGAFVKDFEKANPDAKVKVTAIPWDAAHDKISNAIAAGKTPDVSLVGTTWMGEFAQAKGLDPTPAGLVDKSAFYPGAWDSAVVHGTSYGVPWYVETRVLYYRTDLAKKAGWQSPPTTWSQLTAFAKDLKTKGGAKYGISLQPGQTGSWQTFMPLAWENGAELTSADGKAYTLNTPQMTQALDYYKSFFTAGLSQKQLLQPGELEQGFAKGEFGSFISGPWHVALVEQANKGSAKDKFAVAPLPGKQNAPGTSFVGGGDLAVFKSAKNRDGAWKLVRWLSRPEVQSNWYRTVSDLPSVQSAWQSGTLASDPRLKVFGEQLDKAKSPPAVPTWEQVAAVIDSDVEKAVKGATPTSSAVKDMQRQAASIGTGL